MRVIARNVRPGTDFDVTTGIIAQKLQFYLSKATESDFPLYLHVSSGDFFVSNRVISPTGNESKPEAPPYVSFSAYWPSRESGLLSILPHVSSGFADLFSQVTSLELSLSPELSFRTHPAIANVLQQAKNVTSLVRLNKQTAHLFLRLEGVKRPRVSTQTKDVIFPFLRTIHFTEPRMSSYTGADLPLQSLVDFMRYRISIAAPMKEVYFADLSDVSRVQNEMASLGEARVLVAMAQRDRV